LHTRHTAARTADHDRARQYATSQYKAFTHNNHNDSNREQGGSIEKIEVRRVVRASLTRHSKPHHTIRVPISPGVGYHVRRDVIGPKTPEKEMLACLVTGINPCLFRINLNVLTLAALQKLPQFLQCFS